VSATEGETPPPTLRGVDGVRVQGRRKPSNKKGSPELRSDEPRKKTKMSWIATESATAPDHIGKPVENATETKNPHETRGKTKPDGKAGYGFALLGVPMQVIVGKWSKNPDAPKLRPHHRDFLNYLWSAGGQMQNVDEYTVEVEVDPRYGVGRDEYAANAGVAKSTVARWVSDLKAHGLLATRKTKLREKNPMGQGRTVWIVRLPVNAIADARDVRKARATDERERREQFTDWRDGCASKPEIRTPKHRAERAVKAVFNGQADGHTVQEPTAPQVSPVRRATQVSPVGRAVQVSPVRRATQVSPVRRAETDQQPFRKEQLARTPPRTTCANARDASSKPDANAQAVRGGELGSSCSERQPTAALPRGGEDVEPVDTLAVEVLTSMTCKREVAETIVREHGGAFVIACADVHRRAKGLGVGLFVQRMRSHNPHEEFEHRDGKRTIRPTRDGHLEVDLGDGVSNPVTRRQTMRDYERVLHGGHLRTVAEGDYSPCD